MGSETRWVACRRKCWGGGGFSAGRNGGKGGEGEGEGDGILGAWMRGGERGGNGRYLFEKMVVDLFCGADFYGAHHFAGGDDDAAEGFGRGGHGRSCVLIDGLIE